MELTVEKLAEIREVQLKDNIYLMTEAIEKELIWAAKFGHQETVVQLDFGPSSRFREAYAVVKERFRKKGFKWECDMNSDLEKPTVKISW